MALLDRGADITVAVESDFNVRELAEGAARSGQKPSAIVEVDSGMHRCGTATPAETIALVRTLQEAGIEYRGIMGYEGHAVLLPDEAERKEKAGSALGIVAQHVEALAEAGLRPRSSPSAGRARSRSPVRGRPSRRSRPAPTSSWTAAIRKSCPAGSTAPSPC
jgi:D-serine deaminase-like pyridoxal phosphate-dependent protein